MAGYFTNGMDVLATALTGDERIGVDTGFEEGATPQCAAVYPAQLAAGASAVSVPLTGFAITIPDNLTWYIIEPAGTLATGAFTMPANPFEGQVLWVASTQTQTAVTFAANTGHSLVGTAVTAMTRSVAVGWLFRATKWYRVQ